MMHFLRYVQGSLDNFTMGASAKKLTALLLSLLVVYIHLRFCSPENAEHFLDADLIAITALLGVSTIERLRQNKPTNTPNEGTFEN